MPCLHITKVPRLPPVGLEFAENLMPVEKDQVSAAFAERFGRSPRWIVRAPGRVNLIGEHTDYNDGFVLPVAIDRAIWIAAVARDDSRVTVHSLDYDERGEFSLDGLSTEDGSLNNQGSGWIEYLKGTAWSLQSAGHELSGWEGVLKGDVPLGAGLSSSAALEVATARAFAAVGGLEWDPIRMAKLGQKAENQWVGVNCGIMDQLISAAGREGHALLVDCRSLETRPVPFPPGVAVIILDTSTRRGLVDSAYNERRAQCEAAAEFFGARALRDVDQQTLQAKASDLNETVLRRARHVITENDRTLAAVDAMGNGDLDTLGRLMIESHVSLRDDYEVSSDALNAIVDSANAQAACFGARMTGAGFGGCAVAIVESGAADTFSQTVAADYEKQTGHTPTLYVCQASNGAQVVKVVQVTE
jgi:galactokinase